MGLPADSVAIVLVDSLAYPATDGVFAVAPDCSADWPAARSDAAGIHAGRSAGDTPFVAAAEASLRRPSWRWRASIGWCGACPRCRWAWTGATRRTTRRTSCCRWSGVAIPLPLLDRNRGPIAQAEAERDRARAELDVGAARGRQRLVEGARERATLLRQVARDRDLVARADRVAAKSLAAYREGAWRSPRCSRRAARRATCSASTSTTSPRCSRWKPSCARSPGPRLRLHDDTALAANASRSLALAAARARRRPRRDGACSKDAERRRGHHPGRGGGADRRCERANRSPTRISAIGTVVARPGHFAALSAPAPTRVARVYVQQRAARGGRAAARRVRAGAVRRRGRAAPKRR